MSLCVCVCLCVCACARACHCKAGRQEGVLGGRPQGHLLGVTTCFSVCPGKKRLPPHKSEVGRRLFHTSPRDLPFWGCSGLIYPKSKSAHGACGAHDPVRGLEGVVPFLSFLQAGSPVPYSKRRQRRKAGQLSSVGMLPFHFLLNCSFPQQVLFPLSFLGAVLSR